MDFHSVLAESWSWLLSKAFAIAWWGTLVCMVFAARVAGAFLRDNPRMFSVTALLACAWALVLGYYGATLRDVTSGVQPPLSERELQSLASDVASVLLVYAGGLLILDTTPKHGESRTVVPIQSYTLYCLLFIAVPKVIDIISAPNGTLIGISANVARDVVSASLVAFAFIAIGIGAYRISNGISRAIFLVLLAVYGVLLVYANTQCVWNACSEEPPITQPLALAFAALKIAVNLQFCWMVGVHGMTQSVREAGPVYWVLLFLRFHGPQGPWRRAREAGSAAEAAQPPSDTTAKAAASIPAGTPALPHTDPQPPA